MKKTAVKAPPKSATKGHLPTTKDTMMVRTATGLAASTNPFYWKAQALGYHIALQQQQKGIQRMRKTVERLKSIQAKLEARISSQKLEIDSMAKRLDAVRAFSNPDAKMIHFTETAKAVEEALAGPVPCPGKKAK